MSILGTVGIADKGTYSPTATYKKGNFVLHNGSSWLVLQDELTGVEPIDDGVNWKYLARGFLTELLSEISATDTSGLLGTAGITVTGQALIDKISDRVDTKLIPYTHLVNNGTTTETGQYALDANYGKTLADGLATLNSNLTEFKGNIQIGSVSSSESVASGSYVDKTFTFPQAFSSIPVVLGVCNSANTASVMANLSCSVYNVSTTGFTVRFANNSSTSTVMSAIWLAILK